MATRRAGEDILARELSARGVRGIPGYQLTGDKPVRDSEALRRNLEQVGIKGTVIMRVIDRRVELDYVPGGWGYGSMYGYWEFGWGMMGRPGYLETDTIVSVETLVYSLPEDKLLWGGVSETTDPNNLDSFIKEVVRQGGRRVPEGRPGPGLGEGGRRATRPWYHRPLSYERVLSGRCRRAFVP